MIPSSHPSVRVREQSESDLLVFDLIQGAAAFRLPSLASCAFQDPFEDPIVCLTSYRGLAPPHISDFPAFWAPTRPLRPVDVLAF